MSYIAISLSSKEPLSLIEKQAYVNSLYRSPCTYQADVKRNQGFVHKFASSIGFKPVLSYVDNGSQYFNPEELSPETYKNPVDLLFEGLNTPVQSLEIINFVLPVEQISHPKDQFSYWTKDLAEKAKSFFQKVFPELEVKTLELEESPTLSVKDFVLEHFYRSLDENNYTNELSIPFLLKKEEVNDIIQTLQVLTDIHIGIAQYKCNVCKHNSGGKNKFHIEVVYLSRNGESQLEEMKKEYGKSLFIIKSSKEVS